MIIIRITVIIPLDAIIFLLGYMNFQVLPSLRMAGGRKRFLSGIISSMLYIAKI